ncbi:MAG: 30S ribosome-binding factor RbfA [Eubacteriales bacterium]|nr:30S ribosome-binding factor RbfA [Eubacteriales bacterium]
MRKNSVKNRRINDEVRRALAEIIERDLKDPRIDRLTSVLQVEVAPDLKTCKVWISVYSGGDAGEKTIAGLRSAVGYIRSALAKKVNLRNTPELHFILDDSIAYGVAMSHRIDEISAADRAAQEARGEEPEEAAQDMPETM